MKPQDPLFNWTVRKDAPGTVKTQLPRIIVTPPTVIAKPVAQRKKRSRNACHAVPVSAQTKLVLDPEFWSPNKMDTPKARKQKFLFQCRRAECAQQFHSAKNRDKHERHCLTIDEVCMCVA